MSFRIETALGGALFGALAAVVFGFTLGGWVTGVSSRRSADDAATAGVAAALLPYCVERSKSDAVSAEVIERLRTTSGNIRLQMIEQAGWATPLGAKTPNWALSALCTAEIVKLHKL